MFTTSTTSIKTKLVMDVLIAGLVLALLSTSLTGLVWHEWLGLAVATAIIVHLLLGWSWIVSITRRFFGSLPNLTRFTYLLNFTLFIAMLLTIYYDPSSRRRIVFTFNLSIFQWSQFYLSPWRLSCPKLGLYPA